jgi:hypothetical protein
MTHDFREYYAVGVEEGRVDHGGSSLEFERTKELLDRFLPPPPANVLDVGGGPGAYSSWLAQSGYRAHLIDPVPLHVEQAGASATRLGLDYTAALGDARELEQDAGSWDVVLMLGPLYHLTERNDGSNRSVKLGASFERMGSSPSPRSPVSPRCSTAWSTATSTTQPSRRSSTATSGKANIATRPETPTGSRLPTSIDPRRSPTSSPTRGSSWWGSSGSRDWDISCRISSTSRGVGRGSFGPPARSKLNHHFWA